MSGIYWSLVFLVKRIFCLVLSGQIMFPVVYLIHVYLRVHKHGLFVRHIERIRNLKHKKYMVFFNLISLAFLYEVSVRYSSLHIKVNDWGFA